MRLYIDTGGRQMASIATVSHCLEKLIAFFSLCEINLIFATFDY